jgi:hypothetical protein
VVPLFLSSFAAGVGFVALCQRVARCYQQKRTKVQALAAMLVEIGLRAQQMFLSLDYEEFIGAKKHLVWGLLAHTG